MERPESQDPRNETKDRAEVRVTGTAMADLLVAHPILLPGEGQGGEGGRLQVGHRAVHMVQGTRADPQGDVAKTKQVVRDCIGYPEILAGAEHKIKTNGQALGGREGRGCVLLVRHGQERNRQRLDPGWRRVSLGPSLEKRRKAKIQGTVRIHARVRGPHPGIHLANAP